MIDFRCLKFTYYAIISEETDTLSNKGSREGVVKLSEYS